VTSELLAGLSIGLPVGLAIYLAWLHTDWPGRTRTIGLAGSLAAALVGAWLGFNVIDGLFAVVTASLGAQLGANLTLIVFDILRERAVPEAVPEAPTVTAGA
jgi:hypothetical protein